MRYKYDWQGSRRKSYSEASSGRPCDHSPVSRLVHSDGISLFITTKFLQYHLVNVHIPDFIDICKLSCAVTETFFH